MAFLDQMKDKLNATGQKAKDMTEISRLNSQINEVEKAINELYRKLGVEIYDAYREEPIAEGAELIAQITEHKEKVEALTEQIKIINPAAFCLTCGARIDRGAAFCTNCGSKVVVEKKPAAVCPGCGAALEKGALFCTSCGTRVKS